MDAIAVNGSVAHTEESKLPENQISAEVKMSDNANSVPNPEITKNGDHGTVTNDTNIENSNHDKAENYKLVNTEGKTDLNEDDQANSNEDTDRKVDDKLTSLSTKSAEPSTIDAEDTDADSNIASDKPRELFEPRTSIALDDGLNDNHVESPDRDTADGPLPTEASESNQVTKSSSEQTQRESVVSEEDQGSPPKTGDYLDERQSPEGSSNDSPRPHSPRDKLDSAKITEDDPNDQQSLDLKKDVKAVQQSQDRPATDDDDESDESGDPKTDTVKPIDDDGLLMIQANKVDTSSSAVTSSEAIPKSSEESAAKEQREEVLSSDEERKPWEDASEPLEGASERWEAAPESWDAAPEPLEDAPLTNKAGDNKPESNSEITKSTDQQDDSEQKPDDKDAEDNQQSDNDTPPENTTLSDGDRTQSEPDNGRRESDSVDSNVAVVKPMMRSSSQDEDNKGQELQIAQSVENAGTYDQTDRLLSKVAENLSENHPDSPEDLEKAVDKPQSNVDESKELDGEELSKDDEIPVGQPPLATHFQTGNSKSDHKTDAKVESAHPEPAKSDNESIGSTDANDVSDRSDNELGNNCDNNSPVPEVISNITGDNKDVDEKKDVEVKDTSDDNIMESTENNEVKEGTENNKVMEVTASTEIKEVTETTEVTENTEVKEVTENTEVKEVTANNDEVTEGTANNDVKEVTQNDPSGETNENLKASDEERTGAITQAESPLQLAEEAQIEPQIAQKLGSAVQDDKKDEDIDQPAHSEPPSVANEETTEDQKSKDEDPQKKTSVSSQTSEEKETTPEVEHVPEEVQKDDFTKWLLEEEAAKSAETSDPRGQDRTPTPVRKATPETPKEEASSTEEEYKEPTPAEKKSEEIENEKRGKDDDKGELRAGTDQRGEDSQEKETDDPKETEVQKVENKPAEPQDPKPPQSKESQVDTPQTKRKSSLKQKEATNQKPTGRRRSVRVPKPIPSQEPKQEQKRPVQRSKSVEANKSASRPRPLTREKKAPPPNKGSTGSRPETTNGRIRQTTTSSNGRLLQRETTRTTSQKSQRPKTTGVRDNDGRAEQKEFFRKELTRIEEGLKKEVSKIQKPPQKKHTPFIFNDLKPYYDTSSQRYLIETPEEQQLCYSSRTTAIGLIDPWKNLEMDKSVLPVLESKPINRGEMQKKKEKKIDERAKKTKHEGSTRLPKYPVVTLETSDLATKKLYYSDVPMLREELKQKYSANATKKVEEDYEKTKQDFYRMDLDKLNEVHPVNREHMRSTYFAYLQNTPGSKKAINECVKSIDKSEKAN